MTGFWARCGECPWHTTGYPNQASAAASWRAHHDHAHGEGLATVTQLPAVTFHQQALLALRALAQTGRPFTVGEAHPMVEVPAPNPRTDWENARREAERLGWIEWTGEYTESVVPSTKSSAVKKWRGTYAARRTA